MHRQKFQIFLLYGGGIDSTALLFWLRDLYPAERITLVHVDYGQHALASERAAARYYAKRYNLEFVKLKTDFSFSSAEILKRSSGSADVDVNNRLELRNVALITLVASYAASTVPEGTTSMLALGFHQEPANAPFPDARPDFLLPLEYSLNLATNSPIRLLAPLVTKTRTEILKFAIGKDRSILMRSHTCYKKVPCGVCTHCYQREQMLKEIGIE